MFPPVTGFMINQPYHSTPSCYPHPLTLLEGLWFQTELTVSLVIFTTCSPFPISWSLDAQAPDCLCVPQQMPGYTWSHANADELSSTRQRSFVALKAFKKEQRGNFVLLPWGLKEGIGFLILDGQEVWGGWSCCHMYVSHGGMVGDSGFPRSCHRQIAAQL